MLNSSLGFQAMLARGSPSPVCAIFIDTQHEGAMAMIREAFADSIVYTIRGFADRFVLVVDFETDVTTLGIGGEEEVIAEMCSYFNSDLSNAGALQVGVKTDAATRASIYAAVNEGTA